MRYETEAEETACSGHEEEHLLHGESRENARKATGKSGGRRASIFSQKK